MNKHLRALLSLTLALLLTIGLCACGGEEPVEEIPQTTKSTHDPQTYDPLESYRLTKMNNAFDFTVLDYAGNVFYSRQGEPFQPSFNKLTDSVLEISAPSANTPQHRWAVFCDVRQQKVSSVFGNFLYAKGDYVAQLEHLTDKYHVFVRCIFDDSVEPQVTTLEGLEIGKDNQLFEKADPNKDGDLEIVYNTKDGKKTVVVKMP